MNENETEFGIDRVFIYGSEEENNYTYFLFNADELQEFFITDKVFSLDIGRVKIKVGEPLDKLKNVPKLKMARMGLRVLQSSDTRAKMRENLKKAQGA